MRPLLNDTAKALFVAQLNARGTGFSFVKSRKTFFAGAAVFERAVDKQRCAWLAFNGFKDSYFALGAGWTVSGLNPTKLEHWSLHARQILQRADVLPPPDGFIDLRDRYRFIKEGDAYFNLDLPFPSKELKERGYQEYLGSQEFEEHVQKLHRGALIIYKKNPPSVESVREEAKRVEWSSRDLWMHLVDRGALSKDDVEALVQPIVTRAVEIACKHGVPFLNDRLCESR
jgi:hypothetical protein